MENLGCRSLHSEQQLFSDGDGRGAAKMAASPAVKEGNQPGDNGVPSIRDTQNQGQLHGYVTCSVTQGPTLRKAPTKLGLMLYCRHLEILNHFGTREPALGTANSKASPAGGGSLLSSLFLYRTKFFSVIIRKKKE